MASKRIPLAPFRAGALPRVPAAALAVVLALALNGCVSARMSDVDSNIAFRDGRYAEASDRLRKGLAEQGEQGKDELLYLLDLGLVLHTSGQFEESNRYFLKADQVAEIKDYTSLSQEAGTLLTSDNIKDYKGEDFENVLISTYLAMNYALLGDHENALVEARRVNRKLYRMVTEGKRKYKQSAFARYLSAILYETQSDYADAYIDYKKVYELEPAFPGLGRDLWRTGRLAGFREDLKKWDREYELSEEDHVQARQFGPKSAKGEIIVLYENGLSPIKRPNPQFQEIPKFYPRFNPVSQANVLVNGSELAKTEVLQDIERTAIENLDEKYAGLIAKKIAGVVAKEFIGDQLAKRTGNELVGFLAKAYFYLSDQADVRSWNLLPRDLQLARIPVEAGSYEVQVVPIGSSPLPAKKVEVPAGRKVFVNFRYIP
jgi:hypothetical protein